MNDNESRKMQPNERHGEKQGVKQDAPFSQRLAELEKIYHLIQDSDDKDLEKIISLYERGMKLASSLEKNISAYELRIQEVTAASGEPSDEQFEDDDLDSDAEHAAENYSGKPSAKSTEKLKPAAKKKSTVKKSARSASEKRGSPYGESDLFSNEND